MNQRTPHGGKSPSEPYPDEILAIQAMDYSLKGFKRFAGLLGLKIHPFQAYMLRFYFAGVTELVIIIPKKNGKTTLLAALALYHLLMTPGAECVIGAASREQAALLHGAASNLIQAARLERRSVPGNEKWTRYEGVFEVREGMHVIRFERGRIRVLPHEVRTGDGVMPTLALVDELHRHPTGQLYGVFRDGIDSQDGQMITISTAGASFESPLGVLLEKARKLPMDRIGRRHTYTAPHKAFTVIEWALHPEDNVHDIRRVKQANPAPWHTPTKLRRRHDSPSMTSGQWLRFACGIWTHGDEPPIKPGEWDRCRVDIGGLEPGEAVVLVPSVGHNGAIAIAAMREDRVAVGAEVLEHAEGSSMLAAVETRIVELAERYRVTVHHPVGGFVRSADILTARGIPMVEAAHSPARLVAASGTFNRLLRSGLLMHDGDPVLREHVLAAQLKVSEQGERYLIADASRALLAVVMATHAASAAPPAAPTVAIGWT